MIRVRVEHMSDSDTPYTPKTVSNTPHSVYNKIKEKILCHCCVLVTCRLCLKKGVKGSEKIKNRYY